MMTNELKDLLALLRDSIANLERYSVYHNDYLNEEIYALKDALGLLIKKIDLDYEILTHKGDHIN